MSTVSMSTNASVRDRTKAPGDQGSVIAFGSVATDLSAGELDQELSLFHFYQTTQMETPITQRIPADYWMMFPCEDFNILADHCRKSQAKNNAHDQELVEALLHQMDRNVILMTGGFND